MGSEELLNGSRLASAPSQPPSRLLNTGLSPTNHTQASGTAQNPEGTHLFPQGDGVPSLPDGWADWWHLWGPQSSAVDDASATPHCMLTTTSNHFT